MPAKPRRASPRSVLPSAGAITLSETEGVRYLHFGTEWVQGAMRIARPYALEIEYQQQMMAPWLLLPRPARVLQLGLGAAALTKFCHRHLTGAETVAVDLDPGVVAAARRWFRLPDDDDRLSVIVGDAQEFLGSLRGRGYADWLQVDLYDAQARGPVYDDPGFYRACRSALRSPGVAVFNLFGRALAPSLDNIRLAFADRVLCLPQADAGNCVVLAVHGPRIDLPFSTLFARARRIEDAVGLPARKWVSGLRASSSPEQPDRGAAIVADPLPRRLLV
jgi:spermidine synthase